MVLELINNQPLQEKNYILNQEVIDIIFNELGNSSAQIRIMIVLIGTNTGESITEKWMLDKTHLLHSSYLKARQALVDKKWITISKDIININYNNILTEENKAKIDNDNFYLYKYVNTNNEIVYIGKTSRKLEDRIEEHTHDKLYNFKGNIYYFTCKNQTDMDMLEYVLINSYHPIYNKQYKDFSIQTSMVEPEWKLFKTIE